METIKPGKDNAFEQYTQRFAPAGAEWSTEDALRHALSAGWWVDVDGQLATYSGALKNADVACLHRALEHGLHDYATGDFLRPATPAEVAESFAAENCPEGVIVVDGRSCYVD